MTNRTFTNGEDAFEKACLVSAPGEYFERLSCNYFFADFYLRENLSQAEFVHCPEKKWFDMDYICNGMSAGNSKNEARMQVLPEIFKSPLRNSTIASGLCLTDTPKDYRKQHKMKSLIPESCSSR